MERESSSLDDIESREVGPKETFHGFYI